MEERDAELVIFLSSLQLDEVPQPGDHLSLPQEVIECAAAVSVKGEDVTRELKEAMARIASISADVETSISEMREDLKVRKTTLQIC